MSKEPREICIVRVRRNDRWRAEFVIDGRRYDTAEEFERVTTEAFLTINEQRIVAEFGTSEVSDSEPPLRLPSWEEYRSTLDPTL
ncbi:hypothetical protein [Nocardia higoensis]|uniref:hypothetical protein n=1 Tax=Nocardia higoensis TaxID=228599 RepID=UPI0005937707|nr:hypothetical protein [Nocardia higoensis]